MIIVVEMGVYTINRIMILFVKGWMEQSKVSNNRNI